MSRLYVFYNRVVDDIMKSVHIHYYNGYPWNVSIKTKHLNSTTKYEYLSSCLKMNEVFYDDIKELYGIKSDEVESVIDVLVERVYGR